MPPDSDSTGQQDRITSSAAIVAHPTDIPGLFDVLMPDDGTWRNDLTQGQVTFLAMQTPWARLEMARRAD